MSDSQNMADKTGWTTKDNAVKGHCWDRTVRLVQPGQLREDRKARTPRIGQQGQDNGARTSTVGQVSWNSIQYLGQDR
jgi:hypothetical protein